MQSACFVTPQWDVDTAARNQATSSQDNRPDAKLLTQLLLGFQTEIHQKKPLLIQKQLRGWTKPGWEKSSVKQRKSSKLLKTGLH